MHCRVSFVTYLLYLSSSIGTVYSNGQGLSSTLILLNYHRLNSSESELSSLPSVTLASGQLNCKSMFQIQWCPVCATEKHCEEWNEEVNFDTYVWVSWIVNREKEWCQGKHGKAWTTTCFANAWYAMYISPMIDLSDSDIICRWPSLFIMEYLCIFPS